MIMSKWRVGQSLGRTLYAQMGDEPSKSDEFLGIMDNQELAELVVNAVNEMSARNGMVIEDRPLVDELSSLLNRHSAENNSNTPDFILAAYLTRALSAYECAVIDRDSWYGIKPEPGWDGATKAQPT